MNYGRPSLILFRRISFFFLLLVNLNLKVVQLCSNTKQKWRLVNTGAINESQVSQNDLLSVCYCKQLDFNISTYAFTVCGVYWQLRLCLLMCECVCTLQQLQVQILELVFSDHLKIPFSCGQTTAATSNNCV